MTAQVWSAPAFMDLKRRPPATAAGRLLVVVDPLPSWPKLLLPQQKAVPVAVIAHVWPPPALIVVNRIAPATALGKALWSNDPLPNWPLLFCPQQ